jgi:hypothetical protein
MYFHPLLSIQYVKFLWKGIFNSQLKLIIIVEINYLELSLSFGASPQQLSKQSSRTFITPNYTIKIIAIGPQ